MKRKGLISIFMIFALILAIVPIKALDAQTVHLFGATQNQLTFTLEKGDQTTINFVNQTDQTLNLTTKDSIQKTGTLSSGPSADQDLTYGKDIAPHQSLTLHYAFGNPTGNGSSTVTISYTSAVIKQYQTSQSVDHPVSITSSGIYEGGGGPSYDYYALELAQPSFVKVTMEGESSIKSNYSGDQIEIAKNERSIDTRVEAGKYVIQIAKPQDRLKEYRLHVTINPISFGEALITPATISNDKKVSVQVKLVGADPIVHLSRVDGENASGHEHTLSIDGTSLSSGKKAIEVIYGDDLVGYEKKELSLLVITGKPTLSLANFTSNYNSITYSSKFMSGNHYKVMLYTKRKWKKVKDLHINHSATNTYIDTSFKIKGLKANTKYRLRLDPYTVIDSKTYQGKSSSTLTIWTGLKSIPPIKSINVANVKFKKGYRSNTWVSGYWSGNYYHPGYYIRVPSKTTFTITITLKKKLKGTQGLMINGEKIAGKGKTFKRKITVDGNMKGKKYKLTIVSYKDRRYDGSSKAISRKVTIK